MGRQSSTSPRASTPIPDLPSVESVAADDTLLKQYSAVIVDIKGIETNMLNLWRQVITLMIPGTSHTEGPEAESSSNPSSSNLVTN